jgi:hypothetical protein
MYMPTKVLPVIQTFEPDMNYLVQLQESFKPLENILMKPLMVIDVPNTGISFEYTKVLNRFNTSKFSLYEHKYDVDNFVNICDVAMRGLKDSLVYDYGGILYMEGDIVLSSRLAYIWGQIELDDKLGLLTFYLPGHEYESVYKDRNKVMYPFPGERFYGIQCVYFPRDIVEDLVQNEHELLATFPGYNDIRWKEFLLTRNRTFWCTSHSYAQHIGFDKPHKAPSNPHWSDEYIP